MDILELEKKKIHHIRHPWEEVRAAIAIDKIKTIPLRKQSYILDIGCGDAYFLKRLCEHFPENFFCGIDTSLSEPLIQKISSWLPPQVFLTNALEKVNSPDKKIELVLLMDVIEHVPDDKKFLENIFLTISEKKTSPFYLFITVPAFPYLFSSHDVFLKHYRRYTRAGLIETVNHFSLEIMESGYFFTSLFLARNVILLLEKLKIINPQDKGVSDYSGSAWKTLLYRKMLQADYRIFNFLGKHGIHVPGLSTYVLCKKH